LFFYEFIKHFVRGLYKNKDEIQIASPKLYEGKYFKHYQGGSWHSWDGEIIWWFYNHGVDKRTVKYGIGYLVCAGFETGYD
jgi:hypothetical protein